MKILTWNINGIRAARKGRPLKEILDSLEADVICLQETKVTRDMLDEMTAIVEGYNSYFSFSRLKTGYSGVATFCKDTATPLAAEEGISPALTPEPTIGCYGNTEDFTPEEIESLDAEGRTIITEHKMLSGEAVVVINVYCPRADQENQERVDFKINFYKLLQARAEALLEKGKHVIILGDINTSHKRIDHCDPCEPEVFDANPGRQWLNQFLTELRSAQDNEAVCTGANTENTKMFVDSFRYFHPDQREAFTNWCTVTSARQTNYGTRIDYIFANVDLIQKEFLECVVRPDVEGSDHCPVVATLKNLFVPTVKPPLLCTKYMPEFAGRQQKLQSYFTRKPEAKSTNAAGSVGGFCSSGAASQSSAAEKMAGKRTAGLSEKSYPAKRFKTATGKQNCEKGRQKKLQGFFGKTNTEKRVDTVGKNNTKSVTLGQEGSEMPKEKTEISQREKRTDLNVANPEPDSYKDSASEDQQARKRAKVAAWKSIFKGPRPAPLCAGHQERCVLRTVKIKGPNHGRQFYCCARPQGHASNADARCNFFKWVK